MNGHPTYRNSSHTAYNLTVIQLQNWWQRFVTTAAGQTMVRRSRLILRILVLGVLGCAAVWMWSKGYL